MPYVTALFLLAVRTGAGWLRFRFRSGSGA
jgi:hypothetical protein